MRTDADHGGLTVVHGGGNRFLTDAAGDYVDAQGQRVTEDQKVIGGDTITVLGGGTPESPLVIYGDTSPDRQWYAGEPSQPSSFAFGPNEKPFPGPQHETDFVFPLAHRYDYDGHDTIDAGRVVYSNPQPAVGVVISGGPGDDWICGTSAGDHLGGSSGNDVLFGSGGPDHLYGDSDFGIELFHRTLTVITTAEAGSDWMDGGDGQDLVFGDHGSITQVPGTVRLLTTGQVTRAATTNIYEGRGDVIYGGSEDDVLFGGLGSDYIGLERDGTRGGEEAGRDGIWGDHGFATFYPPGPVNVVWHLESSDPLVGDPDWIDAGRDEDVVFGGTGGDQLWGGDGHDILRRVQRAAAAVAPLSGTIPGCDPSRATLRRCGSGQWR